MNKADLYVTPNNQHRLVIGCTSTGDIAFATRGGSTTHDYNHCQTQAISTFAAEGNLSQSVTATEIARVQMLFAKYIADNGIT